MPFQTAFQLFEGMLLKTKAARILSILPPVQQAPATSSKPKFVRDAGGSQAKLHHYLKMLKANDLI